LEKLTNYKEAIENFNDFIEIDPLMNKAWYFLSNIYYKNQDYHRAILNINKAIDINAEKEEYWKLYAKINIGLSLYEEADIGFQKIIDLGVADESIWIGKSDMLIKLGEYNYAIDILDECYEIIEDKSIITYRLSGIYFLQNKIEEGIIELKKALSLNNKNKYIFKELFNKVANYKYVKNLLN